MHCCASACHGIPHIRVACPFCRQQCGVSDWQVKEAGQRCLAAHCPSHATIVDNSCGDTRLVIAHAACGGGKGWYDCAESTLTLCEI